MYDGLHTTSTGQTTNQDLVEKVKPVPHFVFFKS